MGLRQTMKPMRFKIELEIQAPILVKSSSPAAFGVDAAMDVMPYGPDKGKPRIPGTALRGNLAEAFEQLHPGSTRAGSWIGRWVGREPDSSTDALRGALILGDLVSATRADPGNDRTRIKIDEDMGSVESGMLQVIETPWRAGRPVTFSGIAWLYDANMDDLPGKDAAAVLQRALSWLTQLGAHKTIGFGRIRKATVTPLPAEDRSEDASLAGAECLDVTLRPQQPLCVARHGSMDNLFVSEEFIPGNMLAGAIMETAKHLGLADDLKSAGFDLVRFRHAFPARNEGVRRFGIPCSWTTAGDMVEYPVAKTVGGRAPSFSLDWKDKDWTRFEQSIGVVHPARELRVRTKIDSQKRTADRGSGTATDGGKLFAWETVHPFLADGTPCLWNARIDLTALEDQNRRDKIAELLRTVLANLGFVSKTKALCPASVRKGTPDSHTINSAQPLLLDLVTPALLVDPRWQKGTAGHTSSADLLDLYQEAWSKLSGQSLELTHFFARQQLLGGEQAERTFLKHKAYNPWLLTSAGSVFSFTVKDPDTAQRKLDEWLRQGLGMPDWATQENIGTTWRTNPYLRENGFGEIAIHAAQSAAKEQT